MIPHRDNRFSAPLKASVSEKTAKALLFAVMFATAGGCAAVEGIFKAGVWVGIIAVAVVAVLVALMTGMFRRG